MTDRSKRLEKNFKSKGIKSWFKQVNYIDEFVGLRTKLYWYKMYEGEENKKCLTDRKPQVRKMNVIRSYGHEVYTEEVNKVALSADDDKRHILEDGINTLALGHYRIL